jgi:solute carrier family 6 GABA transporter-like protein 1
MVPGDQPLSTFTVGFLTYPLALAEMPASQFWSVVFFITLAVLGLGSAFALMESLVTMVCDTDWGKRIPRTAVSSIIISCAFLISLIYCTRFGFYLLDAVDKWTNDLSLLFVVFCECVAVTCIYRWKDVVSQVGLVSFAVYNFGYMAGMVLGVAVGHAVSPEAGAGVGFGLFVVCAVVSVVLARMPDSVPPPFFARNGLLNKFWWVAFYAVSRASLSFTLSLSLSLSLKTIPQ